MNNLGILNTSQSEMEEPCDKVIYKRRSSIFQSRVSKGIVNEETDKPQNLNNYDCPSIDNCKRQRVEHERREENFDLQKYISNLKQERKMWLTTLQERKLERRLLAKQKSSLEEVGQNLDIKVLSDSERSFLSAHPNYEYIYESSNKLSNVAFKTMFLNELAYKLNDKFMLRMREKLFKATRQIVDISG